MHLPEPLLAPLRHEAQALRGREAMALRERERNPRRLRQEELSGIHNPFGRAGGLVDAWAFLDLAESAVLCDALEPVLGPDILLWDSELFLSRGAWLAERAREGRYWPFGTPVTGALVEVVLDSGECQVTPLELVPQVAPPTGETTYVLRYASAAARFLREGSAAPNRACALERPLVNYANRPLWLVRGENVAGNSLAKGYTSLSPHWAAVIQDAERANRAKLAKNALNR